MSDEKKHLRAIPDPYDLDNLVLPQDFEPITEKVISKIAIRKPNKFEWISVHPEMEILVLLFERQAEGLDKTTYVIHKNVRDDLIGIGRRTILFPYVTQDNVLRLWPIKQLNPNSSFTNAYLETALSIARKHRGYWIRVVADLNAGMYTAIRMKQNAPPPEFPEFSMDDILKLAFEGKVIDSLDHPAIRYLELDD